MTLWSVSVCPAVFREEDTAGDGDHEEVDGEEEDDDEDEDEDGCRHITIHPDTLRTTATVDGLLPCSQYLIRSAPAVHLTMRNDVRHKTLLIDPEYRPYVKPWRGAVPGFY